MTLKLVYKTELLYLFLVISLCSKFYLFTFEYLLVLKKSFERVISKVKEIYVEIL